jgi:hypothetical protein
MNGVANQDSDLFGVGRSALATARAAFDGRGFFVGARRLTAEAGWVGPADAVCCYVEEEDLAKLGGVAAAHSAGVNTVFGTGEVAKAASLRGWRCLVRIPYTAAEPEGVRTEQLARVGQLLRATLTIDGVLPTPVGEAMGLDTLQFFAACRMQCPTAHVVVELDRLGHKLGQLCLSFGADEILGPIVKQRELRLGSRAGSNEITVDEAALLLRASGFAPCERQALGEVRVL